MLYSPASAMIQPDLHQFRDRLAQSRFVPVWRDLPADLETPVSTYLKLRPAGAKFLLESADGGETVGRYSIIGVRHFERMEVRDREVRFSGPSPSPWPLEGGEGPLEALRKRLRAYDVHATPELPPFFGGAVGYFGYDLVRHIERLPRPPVPRVAIPDAVLLFTRTVVIFDHLRNTCRLLTLADGGEAGSANAERLWHDAVAELDRVAVALGRPAGSIHRPPRMASPGEYETSLDQPAFEDRVRRAQEYIRAGDAFQIVLSRRLRVESEVDAFTIYRALRMLNPSPYMFFLDLDGLEIAGASPEALVTLTGRVCTTRPIAGTRPRGVDAATDRLLGRELLADPKERAEHVMLVDLGRNDLGRVSEYGSVRVTRMMEIEHYSHVIHIVSDVEGRLREDRDGIDLLAAAFPAGTVSGAPKVRAMEIIDELEPCGRGPYAGAVGYVAYNGNLDTCIAIRTLFKHEGMIYLQAGAGIVADSVPEVEFRETEAKLGSCLRAVEVAARGLEL